MKPQPYTHPGKMRARAAAAAALAIATALAGGCLFQPRDAGDPGEAPPIDFVQPTSPEIVLTNVKNALEARYIPFYQQSYSKGQIEMEMDPGEAGALGIGENPFPTWTPESEARRMRSVLNSMSAETELEVIWVDFENVADKWRTVGDEEYYEGLEYRLVFVEGVKRVVYEGRVDLYLKQEGSQYSIWKWIDTQQSQEYHTWCYLRLYQEWDHAFQG